MQCTRIGLDLSKDHGDALFLVLTKESLKSKIFKQIDAKYAGLLGKAIERHQFKGKQNESLNVEVNSQYRHLVLLGWENNKSNDRFTEINNYRKLGNLINEMSVKYKCEQVTLYAGNIDLRDVNAKALFEGLYLADYEFLKYKSKSEPKSTSLKKLTIASKQKLATNLTSQVEVVCQATKLARDLVNTPPNDCKPADLVKQAKQVAKAGKLKIEIYDRAALKRIGANTLLAVSLGSSEAPYLIKMVYKPNRATKKVISIVGKGVTFDSGGLSIKTGSGMETMKMDMAGAAAVIACMQAMAQLKPKHEVRAYIPTTENMINGQATRPGDIVKSFSGKTVEILNTDAEGRLILADALALAIKEKCSCIVDLATLTGACMVALGVDYAGLFASTDKLAQDLINAGNLAGERLWRLPLAPEYEKLIKSDVADIKNIGGPYGGAITGALFLKEFVDEKTPWAHLDIAGPAFSDSNKDYIKKGAVGFGVRTLINFIMQG